jgi:hypothetical protein
MVCLQTRVALNDGFHTAVCGACKPTGWLEFTHRGCHDVIVVKHPVEGISRLFIIYYFDTPLASRVAHRLFSLLALQ